MSNHKKMILNLYRIKLRYCINNFGYKCGDWYNYKNFDISKKRNLKKLNKKKTFGNYVFNIIRDNYKLNKNLSCENMINNKIDYAFHVLRNLDEIENIYYGDDVFHILEKID